MNRKDPVVLIVDNDAHVRESLAFLLDAAGYATETFDSCAAFLERPTPVRPACLVLDIHMPEMDGLALQERLNAAGSTLPILFLTGYGTVPRSVRAFKAGANDFMEKPVEEERLLAAVEEALGRHATVLARQEERAEVERRFASLSSREREVFWLVVKGLRNREVGALLGIAEKTVKVHRGRVMEKMAADGLADLVGLAERFLNE